MKKFRENRSYRGVLQSDDGIITNVIASDEKIITFQTKFGISDNMIERLKYHPEHIMFSERSRIARLGVQISCEPPRIDHLKEDSLILTQTATPMISGYPGFDLLGDFFNAGLPVGRLIFCDPETLLTSDEVMDAIEKAEIKLPESTTISSDGSILIAPHKVIYEIKNGTDRDILGRILQREDGRQLLNRYQVMKRVPVVKILPGTGVITTCSMYLNEHYVVLQSGFSLGQNLPATVLDPIKTRGIRIYLEIINQTENIIVNPLIKAKVYGVPQTKNKERRKNGAIDQNFSYERLKRFQKRFSDKKTKSCHFHNRPIALIENTKVKDENIPIFCNTSEKECELSVAGCVFERRDLSQKSEWGDISATSQLKKNLKKNAEALLLNYFPNLFEHHDIIDLAYHGKIKSIYFFEPSYEHGPFLSQQDHHRLEEFHAFGLQVYWISRLTRQVMIHTMRDGMGYFVSPDRLASFHKSMLFAFYGSTLELTENGVDRLGALLDELIGFWGKNIGIVTGGGSGVMEVANHQARKRGILSGANFLEITDQKMTTDVDFCQLFQSTCRHSRQKWFEVASFPIFNVGGLGTLEEIGITLCNMKLSILDPVPIILFDTEGNSEFWDGMKMQIEKMVQKGRAPSWILDNVVISDDPKHIVSVYRQNLNLF